MKIWKFWKFTLKKARTQLVKMPVKSKILDIQLQEGGLSMWVLVSPETEETEIKINRFGPGEEIPENVLKDDYLAPVQDGEYVWHFFRAPAIVFSRGIFFYSGHAENGFED
mgnify:CR=1 FL=1